MKKPIPGKVRLISNHQAPKRGTEVSTPWLGLSGTRGLLCVWEDLPDNWPWPIGFPWVNLALGVCLGRRDSWSHPWSQNCVISNTTCLEVSQPLDTQLNYGWGGGILGRLHKGTSTGDQAHPGEYLHSYLPPQSWAGGWSWGSANWWQLV